MRDIQLAEQYGKDDIDILMATGEALLSLGDRDAAMQRFARALGCSERRSSGSTVGDCTSVHAARAFR